MFFWNSCFFNDPAGVGNLISGSSAFSKTRLNTWKFTVHVLLKPGLENFEHYFTSMWDGCNCAVVWAFLILPFLGIGMKTDFFHSCSHSWVFQMCWHIECSTLTASSFRIWNSSAGTPSPPLAWLVVMLPKAHLTLHSRMSDSRWVITPLILWVMKIFFVQFFCVFLPPLNIFCFCYTHNISVLYWVHLCMKCSLGISNFLEEISSLSHSIVPSIFLHWSLRKVFLSLLAILWNSAFKWVYLFFSPLLFASLLFTAICKASSDSHAAFLLFFFLGMVLIPVSCTMSWASAYSSSVTLSI